MRILRKIAVFDGPVDADGVQVSSGQDENGREIPDPVPFAVPTDLKRPDTLAEMIKRMVRSETLNAAIASEDFDTFDEASDFDVEDDPLDPHTPYEAVFDPIPDPAPAAPAAAPAAPTGGVQGEPPLRLPLLRPPLRLLWCL